jgi:hypothetical protein
LTSCTIYREEQNIRRIFIGHFKSTSWSRGISLAIYIYYRTI